MCSTLMADDLATKHRLALPVQEPPASLPLAHRAPPAAFRPVIVLGHSAQPVPGMLPETEQPAEAQAIMALHARQTADAARQPPCHPQALLALFPE